MPTFLQYAKDRLTEDTSPGPSPQIWSGAPVLESIGNPGVGIYHHDDFVNCDALAGAGTDQSGVWVSNGAYFAFIDGSTGATKGFVRGATNVFGGAVEIAAEITDNLAAVLTQSDNTGNAWLISDTSGSDHKMWFESRIKVSSIANSQAGFFLGLTQEGLGSTTGVITDAGAIADIDCLGFHRLEGDGDMLDIVYGKNGGTQTTVLADAVTLVADTFIKVGWIYDPLASSDKRIRFFYNGKEITTYVTSTNIASANFPDGEELVFTAAVKQASTTAHTLTIDWIRILQLRDSASY